MKYIKSKQNLCDFSSRHPYKDLLKVKLLAHYVNFVADGTTTNALTIDIIKKATKNDKLLHQVIKLARRNTCYKINKPLISLNYTKNLNTFKHFSKSDFELTVDDLVLKSNRIVIPSEPQNHVVPLATKDIWESLKQKNYSGQIYIFLN